MFIFVTEGLKSIHSSYSIKLPSLTVHTRCRELTLKVETIYSNYILL